MNLLCPNCQKMLTVPEQYAGQLMKCPLCAGTFTVPGLPAAPPAAPPPAATGPPLPGTYGLTAEPSPAPVPSPVTGSPSTAPLTSTASTAPASPITGTPPPPRPPGGPLTFSIRFKPDVVRWIAPGALILCLILMLFFPWIGVYPGGQPAAWQYAWQIPFGLKGDDPDLQKHPELRQQFHSTTSEELKDGSETKDNQPSYDLLLLFYWPFFLLTLAVTVACAALPFLPVKVPPGLEPFMQWRWGIVASLNVLLFLVLCLQLIWGFSWEESVYAWKMSKPETVKLAKSDSPDTIQTKTLKALKGEAANLVQRTFALRLVVLLQIVAIAGAVIMLGLERRTNPTPVHLDLVV